MRMRFRAGLRKATGTIRGLTVSLWLATAMLALGIAPQAAADPIPSEQALADGCQRNDIGLLDWQHGGKYGYGVQSWVYVSNTRAPVQLSGLVTDAHASDEDLYAQHETRGVFGTQNYYINHDINIFVDPDPQYEDLLATGNTDGILEAEAMTGQWALNNNYAEWRDFYPTAAWPKHDDRVDMIGPEVWDCGHFDQGERTELHPPAWVHVKRALPVGFEFTRGQPTIATEHTLYGSSNKQKSGIISEWELTCSQGACQDGRRQNEDVRNGVETFFLEAPPKPYPDAQLKWRQVPFSVPHLTGTSNVTVVPAADESGIYVTTDVDGTALEDAGYAARWYVGWNKSTTGFKKMGTRFLKIRCNNDLDLIGDGEYQLHFRAYNSYYFKFDAGLNNCDDGGIFGNPDVVTLNPSPTMVTIVPNDQQLEIETAGYENDDPLPGQFVGTYRALWPLADDNRWVTASSNYDAQIQTKVLAEYPPVP